MSRMTRVSLVGRRLIDVPRRTVVSKPQSPFTRRLAMSDMDAPSNVSRTASNFLYANFFRRNAVFLTGVIGAAGQLLNHSHSGAHAA